MAGLWYRAGTVAVTNGSKKVVGTGTTWKSGVSKPDKGHLVWGPDGKPYELDYVESDTVLYLVTAYSGVTSSGMAYSIDISRSGSNSAFSRDLSAFVAYHQLQMDGWQQLLTGTGDVTLTAPDGTKLTVPSWEKIMNAGTGVAAQAKAEADRAKSEASKAAASATAAGDVVAASALPLPDVWAPLSDSLRLITGYGRDVLVGSDVVAKMVNFSRNSTATYIGKDGTLKTAAVNEPRFELDGFLLEGQSTNYIPRSESYESYPKTNLTVSGKVLTRSVTSGESFLGIGTFSLPTGKVTISAAYKKSSAVNFDTFNVYCERFTPKAAHLAKVKEVGDLVVVSATVDADFSAGPASVFFKLFTVGGVAGSVQLEYFQMEALPFASSYIPTNGSAATRAEDRAWIQALGNISKVATVSVIAHPLSLTSMPRSFVFGASGFGGLEASQARYLFTGSGQSITYVDIGPEATSRIFARRTTEVTFGASNRSAVAAIQPGALGWGDFIHIGGVFSSDAYKLPFWGHLRDFKVWMEPRNLTDAQLKAMA